MVIVAIYNTSLLVFQYRTAVANFRLRTLQTATVFTGETNGPSLLKTMYRYSIGLSILFFTILQIQAAPGFDVDSIPGLRKVRDVVIYEDPRFHCAFPSVIKRPDGMIIVAFRRAPDRRVFGEEKTNHIDPNSYLMSITSKDGLNWDKEPSLIYAHPFGGSQDPGLLQLKDKTILCTSYGWAFVRPGHKLTPPFFEAAPNVVFLGGYIVRSTDGGRSWQGPQYPPHIAPEINNSATGEPLHAYNRGALHESNDGAIYWVVAASDSVEPDPKTSTHLIVSHDKGFTWKYSAPVANDNKASFNETSIYETPRGDLVAFLRTAGLDDQACIARSTDRGKTFQPWQQMGFQGHPLHATRLPDDRVLLVYGYRHKPYGIRARILNPECTDYSTAPEIVLRDDGAGTDLGYPWAVLLSKKRVLVAYYFVTPGKPQHIAGTILELD